MLASTSGIQIIALVFSFRRQVMHICVFVIHNIHRVHLELVAVCLWHEWFVVIEAAQAFMLGGTEGFR